MVHGATSPEEKLKDYGFLIYTGENPRVQSLLHKNGTGGRLLVPWTTSSIIRSGSSPNQIEVRIKGAQIKLLPQWPICYQHYRYCRIQRRPPPVFTPAMLMRWRSMIWKLAGSPWSVVSWF